MLGNLHVGSRMVLGYFILRFQSLVTVSMIICLGYLSMILIFEALEFAPKHKKYFKSIIVSNIFFQQDVLFYASFNAKVSKAFRGLTLITLYI